MADRVFVHIGLPKTGTSYLQSLVWPNRDLLARHGLLLPGRERRDHLLSSLIIREDAAVRRRGPGADQAWSVVTGQIAGHQGAALVSHEFFCSASTEQFARMVADLAPARVEIVVTAREPLGLFTSSWQESLKNRSTTPLAAYGRDESADPRVVWDWRALDLGLVLQRLAPVLPADQVHVIVPPAPDQGREELWRRFAGVVGVDPAVLDPSGAFANASMGVVEAELLRRVNAHLADFQSARDRARWIRTVLADRLLVTPDAERYWPDDAQVADARRRADRALALLDAAPYDVVGERERLRVPADLPSRRHPDDVTETELLQASVALNARLLHELRARVSATEATEATESTGAAAPSPAAPRGWRALLRRAGNHPR